MGGLRKYMPITYATMLIGALATRHSRRSPASSRRTRSSRRRTLAAFPGATFAYFCVARGRVRHGVLHLPAAVPRVPRQGALPAGRRRMAMTRAMRHDAHGHGAVHAAPRVAVGRDGAADPARDPVDLRRLADRPMLFGDYFGSSIVVAPAHDGLAQHGAECHGVSAMITARLFTRCRSGSPSPASRPRTYLYIARPALPACCGGSSASSPAAREQVLLRQLQRLVLRRRRARRSAPGCGRSATGGHRRRLRQRLGQGGRRDRDDRAATCSPATSTTTRSR